MSKKTDDKVADVAKWYYYNRPLIPRDDLRKRIEFLETAIHNLLYVNTYLMEDLQKLEHRNHLWLPSDIELNGEFRSFG